MGEALKKVAPGQPLVIPASTWNTFVDAARDYQQRQQSQNAERSGEALPNGVVLIRNDTGSDQARFAVLTITGVVFSQDDNELEFQRRPTFTADLPTAGGTCVIAQEPIPAGKFGRAMILGVSPVQLDVGDEDHEYAGPAVDDSAKLATAGSGVARILWKETGTGTKWGVVQFPLGGAGTTLKFAKITGRAGTAPIWRYSAVQVAHDGSAAFDPENYTTVSGGDVMVFNLINLDEKTGGGSAPVDDGTVVAYWSMAAAYFAFSVSAYRGTY